MGKRSKRCVETDLETEPEAIRERLRHRMHWDIDAIDHVTLRALRRRTAGEQVFGWSRHTIALGLAEKHSGMACIGAQEAFGGNKLWEERHPEAAAALWAIAESHAQQDPTFRSTQAYTRLTARQAREQLRARGFADAELPSPSTMAEVLNRNGCRLRPVVKAKPPKKSRKPMPSSPTSAPRMDAAPRATTSSASP